VGTAGPTASLGDWLAVCQPRLTEPLFHPAAMERLLAIAPFVPGDCLGILETRLTSGAGPVDLSVRLLKPDQSRCMAEQVLPPHLRSFLARWSESGGPFSAVRSVWLEFDLDFETGEFPDPIPCAKLPPEADPLWIVDTLLPALHGTPLIEGPRGRWLSCQREIPEQGRLLYTFSLRARGSDAVRMEIFGLDPGQILEYLGRVAPASLPQAVEIAPLFEGVERIHLSFDISPDGVLPRIGVEGSFPRLPRRDSRWEELFDRLKGRGICDPGKREAALAWPGYDSFWKAPERWPVEAMGARGFCVRGLSHVKVVCEPDREPEAKVYLAFGYSARPAAGTSDTASSAASRSAFSAYFGTRNSVKTR
jgi:hypothetical protein